MQRVWGCPGQQQESGHVVPVNPRLKVSARRLSDCAKTRALLGLPPHPSAPRISRSDLLSPVKLAHCRCRSVVSQYLFSLDIVPVASVTDQVDTILPSVHLARLFLAQVQVQRGIHPLKSSVRSH